MFAGRDFSTTDVDRRQFLLQRTRAINYDTTYIDFSTLWHYGCALCILNVERQVAIRPETQMIDIRYFFGHRIIS
jgi:hypothetical protein